LNDQRLSGISDQIMSPPTSRIEPLEVMDLDVPLHETAVETQPANHDSDCWPFDRWANVDVIGSPKLSGLFENLTLESSGLPDDIESLILSAPAPLPVTKCTRKYLSSSDLMVLCHDGNTSSYTDSGIGSTSLDMSSHMSHFPDHGSATWMPFKFPNSDVLFPSGALVLPSPFSELNPFPRLPSSDIRSTRPSREHVLTWQQREVEHKSKLRKLRRLCDETHPGVINTMNGLAIAYWNQGKFSQAEYWFRKVFSAWQKTNQIGSLSGLEMQIDIIDAVCQQERTKEATEMHQEVHQTIVKTLAPNHRLVYKSLNTMARISAWMRRYEEEEATYRLLLQMHLTSFGLRNETLIGMVELASSMRKQGKYSESERLLRTAVHRSHQATDMAGDDVCWGLHELADLSITQGQCDEGVEYYA